MCAPVDPQAGSPPLFYKGFIYHDGHLESVVVVPVSMIAYLFIQDGVFALVNNTYIPYT
jgi:hypothetical protein